MTTTTTLLRLKASPEDPYIAQKLELLGKQCPLWENRESEGSVVWEVAAAAAGEEEDRKIAEDHFETVLAAAKVMTMNVIDLYFNKARDERRALFAALDCVHEFPALRRVADRRVQEFCFPPPKVGGATTTPPSTSSPVSGADDEDELRTESAAFQALHKEFFCHSKLKLGRTETSGAGLYAAVEGEATAAVENCAEEPIAIAANSDLIKVPVEFLINAGRAAQDVRFSTFMENLVEAAEDEEGMLIAYLIFLSRVTEHGGAGVESAVDVVGDEEGQSKVQARLEACMRQAFSLLPKSLDDLPATLLTWPEEALENLYCPQVIYQVEKCRAESTRLYELLQTEIFVIEETDASPEESPASTAASDDESSPPQQNSDKEEETTTVAVFPDLDIDEVLWARTLIDSRAFNLKLIVGEQYSYNGRERTTSSNSSEDHDLQHDDNDSASDSAESEQLSPTSAKNQQIVNGFVIPSHNLTCVVPVSDYLNHSRTSPLCLPVIENGFFQLRSGCGIPGGVEVCLNYGALQNWELLQYYGFCFDHNPADSLQLELGDEVGSAEVALLLQTLRIPTDHVIENVDVVESAVEAVWPLGSKLLACLRLLHGIGPGDDGDIERLEFDPESPMCAADAMIADCLLEVFGQLKIPEDSELIDSVMTETCVMWEGHPIYGPLARKFRESQRALVRSNAQALEQFKANVEKMQSAAGGRGGKKQRNKKRRRG